MKNLASLRNTIIKMGFLEKTLFKKSNWYGLAITLKILLPFFSFIVLTPVLVKNWGYGVLFPLWVVLGVYGYKISFIIHDCVHNALFYNKKINYLIGYFCGLLTISNYPVFSKHHLNHHSYNNTLKDPDYLESFRFNDEKISRKRLWYLLKPLIGGRILEYFLYYSPNYNKKSSGICLSKKDFFLWVIGVLFLQLLIATFISDFWRSPYLIFLYPFSGATISLFLGRCRFISEHGQFSNEQRDFSRSHLPAFFDKLVLYDAYFNYHLEHHLFPHMPSCHLPKLYNKCYQLIHSEKTLGDCMTKTLISLTLGKELRKK